MPGDDVTLTANFVPDAPKQYTVTVNGGDGASGGGTYEAGAQVTVIAGTRAGYTFQIWTAEGISLADPSQPTITFVMPGNDVTLTANWTGNNPGGGSTGGGSSSDGSHSTPSGTTQKNPDGSTTTTVTRPNGSTTTTTRFPDGSQEVVETRKDGTVTTTTTDAAGNKAEVVQNTDGSSQTTVDSKDGSSSVTVVDEHGTVVSKASLSKANVESAQAAGEAAALPIPGVPVTADREKAPTVTVDLPTGGAVKVEIPVEDVTPGTVAVLVKADGTEVVIKTSLTTEQGVAVTLSAGDTVKIVDNSKAFTDVAASHWGAEGIAFATSRALFTGTSETAFSPDAPMTRGMFVTVLARCADVDTTAGDTWYASGRQWAMEQGISDGSHLDQGLTREQLATMLWRYAGSPVTGADMGGYTDTYRVSGYAQQAMAWAVGQGILTGTTATTLSPQGEATRAQVATILTRFMEDMA